MRADGTSPPARARPPPEHGSRTSARRGKRIVLDVQYAVPATRLPAPAALRRWVRGALACDAVVTLRFVGTAEARRLNARYRSKDYATNVLTFVYDDAASFAADLVLCAPVLRREAREEGKELADHCAHLVVHGMLHLQGLDHATPRAARVMEARETAILATLGVPDPYATPYAGRARRSGARR
jgi:probable rRNA maturation factor